MIVCDTIHPFDLHEPHGIATSSIALRLSKIGILVHILILDVPQGGHYPMVKKFFNDRRISIHVLPKLSLNVGYDANVKRSYELFRFLLGLQAGFSKKTREDLLSMNFKSRDDWRGLAFEAVWFAGTSLSVAYYTMLAQKSGLACFKSQFIVDLNTIPTEALLRRGLHRMNQKIKPHVGDELLLEKSRKDLTSETIADLAILKDEYMVQKVVEWSDRLIVSSQELMDQISNENKRSEDFHVWKWPKRWHILPPLILPDNKNLLTFYGEPAPETDRAYDAHPKRNFSPEKELSMSSIQVREFVYLGKLSAADGLVVFLDAIEELMNDDLEAQQQEPTPSLLLQSVKFVFIGRDALLKPDNPLLGSTYLKMKFLHFKRSFNVSYEWKAEETTLKSLIQYLTHIEDDNLRVAVLPSLFERRQDVIIAQFMRLGVPFLASAVPSVSEAVHWRDRESITCTPGSGHSLAVKMRNFFKVGAIGARPTAAQKTIHDKWKSFFAAVGWNDLSRENIQKKSKVEKQGAISCPAAKVQLPAFSEDRGAFLSIIVTHYNRPKYLRNLLHSLDKQTYKNFEVVLVDDGSTQEDAIRYLNELSWKMWNRNAIPESHANSQALVESFSFKKFQVLREPHKYVGAARNAGARASSGEYLIFLDDDDLCKINQVETLLRVALASEADLVTAGHDLFVGEGENSGTFTAVTAKMMVNRKYIPLGTSAYCGVFENSFGDASFIIRRSTFHKLNGFTEEINIGNEDLEFLRKANLDADIIMTVIPEALHWYRRHKESVTECTPKILNTQRSMRPLHAYLAHHPYDELRLFRDLVKVAGEKILELVPAGQSRDYIEKQGVIVYSSTTDSRVFNVTTTISGSVSTTITSIARTVSVTCLNCITRYKYVTDTCEAVFVDVTRTILPMTLGGRKTMMIGANEEKSFKVSVEPPFVLRATFSPCGSTIHVRFSQNLLVPLHKPLPCGDYIHTRPFYFFNAACLPTALSQCSITFSDEGSHASIKIAKKWLWENSEVAPSPDKLLVWRAGTLESKLFPGSYLFGSVALARHSDPLSPIVMLECPAKIFTKQDLPEEFLGKKSLSANNELSDGGHSILDIKTSIAEDEFIVDATMTVNPSGRPFAHAVLNFRALEIPEILENPSADDSNGVTDDSHMLTTDLIEERTKLSVLELNDHCRRLLEDFWSHHYQVSYFRIPTRLLVDGVKYQVEFCVWDFMGQKACATACTCKNEISSTLFHMAKDPESLKASTVNSSDDSKDSVKGREMDMPAIRFGIKGITQWPLNRSNKLTVYSNMHDESLCQVISWRLLDHHGELVRAVNDCVNRSITIESFSLYPGTYRLVAAVQAKLYKKIFEIDLEKVLNVTSDAPWILIEGGHRLQSQRDALVLTTRTNFIENEIKMKALALKYNVSPGNTIRMQKRDNGSRYFYSWKCYGPNSSTKTCLTRTKSPLHLPFTSDLYIPPKTLVPGDYLFVVSVIDSFISGEEQNGRSASCKCLISITDKKVPHVVISGTDVMHGLLQEEDLQNAYSGQIEPENKVLEDLSLKVDQQNISAPPSGFRLSPAGLGTERIIFQASLQSSLTPQKSLGPSSYGEENLIYHWDSLSNCLGVGYPTISGLSKFKLSKIQSLASNSPSPSSSIYYGAGPSLTLRSTSVKPGHSYCLRCSVFDKKSKAIGASFFILKVNPLPEKGFCLKLDKLPPLRPSAGKLIKDLRNANNLIKSDHGISDEMEPNESDKKYFCDKFGVICHGWTTEVSHALETESYPMAFSFQLFDTNSKKLYPFQPFQGSPFLFIPHFPTIGSSPSSGISEDASSRIEKSEVPAASHPPLVPSAVTTGETKRQSSVDFRLDVMDFQANLCPNPSFLAIDTAVIESPKVSAKHLHNVKSNATSPENELEHLRQVSAAWISENFYKSNSWKGLPIYQKNLFLYYMINDYHFSDPPIKASSMKGDDDQQLMARLCGDVLFNVMKSMGSDDHFSELFIDKFTALALTEYFSEFQRRRYPDSNAEATSIMGMSLGIEQQDGNVVDYIDRLTRFYSFLRLWASFSIGDAVELRVDGIHGDKTTCLPFSVFKKLYSNLSQFYLSPFFSSSVSIQDLYTKCHDLLYSMLSPCVNIDSFHHVTEAFKVTVGKFGIATKAKRLCGLTLPSVSKCLSKITSNQISHLDEGSSSATNSSAMLNLNTYKSLLSKRNQTEHLFDPFNVPFRCILHLVPPPPTSSPLIMESGEPQNTSSQNFRIQTNGFLEYPNSTYRYIHERLELKGNTASSSSSWYQWMHSLFFDKSQTDLETLQASTDDSSSYSEAESLLKSRLLKQTNSKIPPFIKAAKGTEDTMTRSLSTDTGLNIDGYTLLNYPMYELSFSPTYSRERELSLDKQYSNLLQQADEYVTFFVKLSDGFLAQTAETSPSGAELSEEYSRTDTVALCYSYVAMHDTSKALIDSKSRTESGNGVDPLIRGWTSHACTSPWSNSTHIRCQCNHLGRFAVGSFRNVDINLVDRLSTGDSSSTAKGTIFPAWLFTLTLVLVGIGIFVGGTVACYFIMKHLYGVPMNEPWKAIEVTTFLKTKLYQSYPITRFNEWKSRRKARAKIKENCTDVGEPASGILTGS